MERWGLLLGFVLGAIAFAIGGAALYWLKGPAFVGRGGRVRAGLLVCHHVRPRLPDRSSLCIRPSDLRAVQASSEQHQ